MPKDNRKRKWWFRGVKGFLKIFVRKPKYIYLGREIPEKAIMLTNHVGSTGPITHELYFPNYFRFWGTYEMNSGLKSVYKYLSEVYYYQKKHWKKFWAKSFSIIAAPLANMFYKGLNLISTYRDHRLRKTLQESIKTLNNDQTLIIFPENSSDGYHDKLKDYFAGFVVLGKMCLKQGMDIPVYNSYFRKKDKVVIVDKPIMLSELLKEGKDRDVIAREMCDKANALGDMDISEYLKKNKKRRK